MVVSSDKEVATDVARAGAYAVPWRCCSAASTAADRSAGPAVARIVVPLF